MTYTIKDNYDHSYLYKLDSIITRLENNHHSWYIVQISILLAYVTFFTWTLSSINSENIFAASIVLSLTFVLIDILAIFNSFKYLKLGRSFRALESLYLKGEIESWTFNLKIVDTKKYKINKINFTEIIQIIFTTSIIILAISELIIIAL